MLTTTDAYRAVANQLPRSVQLVATRPEVNRESTYFLSKISDIKSAADLVKNQPLLSYVMRAFGLSEMTYAKAFVKRVLEGGVDAPSSLANRLADHRYRDLAETFNFERYGSSTTAFARTQQGTVDRFVRQVLEEDSGRSNEAVRLALYFDRKAPSVQNAYGLLADKALLKVTLTALQLPSSFSALNIDEQARQITKQLKTVDFKDPVNRAKFLERFTSLWDLSNPNSAANTSATIVPLLASFGSQTAIKPELLAAIQTIGSTKR
jgi:Protein of unknown function (DUF1217)